MKKLDILMLKSFLGPFVLTTAVANFILLVQYMLKYFDDFVGKNLGITVFAELLFYFSLNMLQVALPLGVLVASLMTFGNLGENFELTAIKGSGISLPRVLRPIFIFVFLLSIGAFFFNNYTIPAANLKAYSLLYDIKHTKPALDIKEGAFYNGIPDYSIKVKEKLPDGKTLKDVIIYDHTAGRGNKTIILADSSIMYTILDERYLKLELYRGHYYAEQEQNKKKVDQLYRTKYHRMDLVFNLSSFDLKRRKEELFQNNRQMKNIGELSNDIDSFKNVLAKTKAGFFRNVTRSFDFHKKELEPLKQKYQTPPDTTRKPPLHKEKFLSLNASFLGFLMQKPIFVPDILIAEPDSLSDLKWWYPANVPKQTTVFLGPLQYVENVEHDQLKKNVNSAEVLDQRFIALEEDYLGIAANKASKVRGKKNMLNPNEKDVLTLEIDGKLNFSNASIDTLTLDYIEFYVSEGLNKDRQIYSTALNKARNMKTSVGSIKLRMLKMKRDINAYTVEKFKKYAQALACILMFMIGAPLGAIIKKGGLGVPTIIAIFFFIIYYVFGSIGEKTAREGAMNPYFAVWLADLVLLPFGLFFMRQARIDARLFEVDLYNIWIEKLKLKFVRNSK